jgi:hypothetical protein
MPKAVKATVSQQVTEILSMRLAGAGYPEILQHAAENGWAVKARS